MKRIFYLLALVFAFTNANKAQNLIAVEHGSATSFYADIDTAFMQAQNGDKVYLPGGNFATRSSTGNFQINKQLQIIGVGWNIDSNTTTLNTVFLNDIELKPGSIGSTLSGINLTGRNIVIYDSVNNISIVRCSINALTIGSNNNLPPTNISLIQDVLRALMIYNTQYSSSPSILVINSFIGDLSDLNLFRSAQPSTFWNGIVCKNSIIWSKSQAYNYLLGNIMNSTFENCFITNGNTFDPNFNNGNYNNFKNCVFNFSLSYISNNNLISNCFFNEPIDSMFILKTGSTFNKNDNYNLKPNSSFRNSGTDGTDIGIYGGSFPWKDGALPATPHIQWKNIKNKTDANGNLPVQIKVKAQDN
jgi:hypothetical protein